MRRKNKCPIQIIHLTEHAKKRIRQRYNDVKVCPEHIKKDFFQIGEYDTVAIKGSRHTRRIMYEGEYIYAVIDIKDNCLVTFLPDTFEYTQWYYIYDLQERVKYFQEKTIMLNT